MNENESLETRVDALVATYEANVDHVKLFRDQLLSAFESSSDLRTEIHSVRSRIKEPDHLREKLIRKAAEAEESGEKFDITQENLLTRVNDLAGIRILHLYTRQVEVIDKALREIFHEQTYTLVEKPFARTWDSEYSQFFQDLGFEVQDSPTLYTSVHYVVSSASRTPITCEIQVRTLMEEVWGEVNHTINYPTPTDYVALNEQIKVLARVTSSATRLVDSIFLTRESIAGEQHPE